jgi:hypothetical protein
VKLQSAGPPIPAGPTVVLCATAIALGSILLAPAFRAGSRRRPELPK